ncbi:MAG: hypothetical protein R3B93_07550 [Bacteroidia bacterium]
MKILIINSQGHWLNGWMTQPSHLKSVVDVLQKSGLEVETTEVSNVDQLQKTLENVQSNTVVWANAYWVNADEGKLHSLINSIEKYDLPMVGSGLETLHQLLEKDICQSRLKTDGIPIPSNIIITQSDRNHIGSLIAESNLTYPLVLKPSNESRSQGVTLVSNFSEAVSVAKSILKNFPHSKLVIEEFLATDDITCGYLRMGNQEMILPSFNVIEGMDCKKEVFSQFHYTLPPEGEKQVCIKNISILNQLETYLPSIVSLFDIQTVTRVDGRLDKNGIMNFFDINGLPGLNYPVSALIKQCYSHFQGISMEYLFECLIHTIIGDTFLRYNMPILSKIDKHNLFNLESDTVKILRSNSLQN